VNATTTSPDLTCAATAAEISTLHSQAGTILIDVRTKSEFDDNRIDGALNLPLAQIQRKAFINGKSVVLIGNGKSEQDLYAACADLRKTGYTQVKVLKGGMPAWRSSGQVVTARSGSDIRPPTLSPYELWIETLFDANLVMVTKGRSDIRRMLPLAVTIADETPAALKATIERRRKETHDAPLAALVLVTAPNTSPDTLAALRDAIRPTPLLVYSDTNQAFAQQIERQRALWATQARGPKPVRCR
jgi:rhodanese-related sulfurtransferase